MAGEDGLDHRRRGWLVLLKAHAHKMWRRGQKSLVWDVRTPGYEAPEDLLVNSSLLVCTKKRA